MTQAPFGGARKMPRLLGVVFWFLFMAALLNPINSGMARLALLVTGGVFFLLSLSFVWHKKALRLSLLIPSAVVILFLLLPGRQVDPLRLQQAYPESLRQYEGIRYHWGGENKLGIDCSGLIRKAMIRTLAREGVFNLNPGPVRKALELWWYDTSAEAFGKEYRGLTRRLASYPATREIPEDRLKPGDVVVTQDGIHIMAFLGDGLWIEADPGEEKVIVVRAADTRNQWFYAPVHHLRQTLLYP